LEALGSTLKHFIALFRVLENYLSDFDEIWLKLKLGASTEATLPSLWEKVLGSTLKHFEALYSTISSS
jgi:hypothetical protein